MFQFFDNSTTPMLTFLSPWEVQRQETAAIWLTLLQIFSWRSIFVKQSSVPDTAFPPAPPRPPNTHTSATPSAFLLPLCGQVQRNRYPWATCCHSNISLSPPQHQYIPKFWSKWVRHASIGFIPVCSPLAAEINFLMTVLGLRARNALHFIYVLGWTIRGS